MRPGQREDLVRRFRGHGGEVIAPHRALITLDLRTSRVVLSIALAAILASLWVLAIEPVTHFWKSLLEWWIGVLDIPGQVTLVENEVSRTYTLVTPRIEIAARPFTRDVWWIGTIVSLILLVISYLLPRKRALPTTYFLRLLVLLQASAQLFFWLNPEAFPYDVGGYTEVLFIAGTMIIGLVPVLYGCTFSTMDFSRKKKLALPLYAMAHLTLFLPLQLLAHAVILHHASLLVMPLLFWMFGLPLNVAVIIGMFGWAASWKPLLHGRGVWWRPAGGWKNATLPVLLLAALAVPISAQAQDTSRTKLLELGGSYGEYDGDLGDANAQFVRFSLSRAFVDRWSFDVGRAERFGDEGFGFGLGYARNLRRDTSVSAGVSTGTGDVLFPDVRFDVGLEHGLRAVDNPILNLGYTHIESKAENSSDGFGAGLRYYWGPWILSGGTRLDLGQPGDTTSRSASLGLTWGLYKKLYLGGGVEWGDISYVLLTPDEALVDFGSTSYNVGTTWYVREDRGIGARFDFSDTDFYELWSVSVRVFREW